jgi:hypothetical protein
MDSKNKVDHIDNSNLALFEGKSSARVIVSRGYISLRDGWVEDTANGHMLAVGPEDNSQEFEAVIMGDPDALYRAIIKFVGEG